MKKLYTLFQILLITISLANAQPFFLEGDFGTGWAQNTMTDRGVVMVYTIQATATNPNCQFIFNNPAGNYTPKWCGSNAPHVFRPIDSLLTGEAFYYNGGGWDQNMETPVENSFYYTFIIEGGNAGSTSNRNMSVLETPYLPATINTVLQSPGNVNPGQQVDVTVTLSNAPFAGERTFLRYTSDNWTTSTFIEITSFDSNFQGIATIPAQNNGTTISYYILTTERPVPEHATIDYYTLQLNNNTNLNYSYTVESAVNIVLSDDGSITEGSEDGEIITVELNGDIWVASLTPANWTIENMPAGVTVGNIDRINDTIVHITLSGNASADYDTDITNFTVSVLSDELENLNTGTISANSGVTFTAIVESTGIWLHLLSYQNFTHTLGDNASDWINAEIGQSAWNQADIGFGTSNTDTTGYAWFSAEWYEDGTGNNKRVHAQINIPGTLGTGNFYYNARAKDLISDPWHYANDTTWTDTDIFNPHYTITINPVPQPQNLVATPVDSSKISLTWQHDATYANVMVVAKSGSDFDADPVQGTTYNVSDVVGGGNVIYIGTDESFTQTGLNASTHVYYRIYTINNNYYSPFISTDATSTDGTEPYITIADDGNITEGQENGEIIYVTLVNDTFVTTLTNTNWTIVNLPAGVSVGEINRIDETHVQIVLSGNTAADYDTDITNVSVSITSDELVNLTSGSVTANSGVTFTAIIENEGIWVHMLSYQNITHTLGDNASDWINAEIGQSTWNQADIGFGTSNNDTTGYTWLSAQWYEDGTGDNKRVHAQIAIPAVSGTGNFYYVARAKADIADPWHYANDTVWANNPSFSPQYFITINAIPQPTICSATAVNASTIQLEWTHDLNYQTVMIIAHEGSAITGSPAQGTTYNVNDAIGNGTVIYKGLSQQFNHSGLNASTEYFYDFYTVNNDYYSPLNSTTQSNATTNNETICTLNIDLGDDVAICGSNSILLNSGVIASPYGDSLTITYNALSGVSQLAGATKVYVHAGVELHPFGGWQYTTGNWGADDGVGLMTDMGNDTWQITINPVTYFGFPADSSVFGLFLVFRNADGTLTGKDDSDGDIWVDMSQNPPQSAFSGVNATLSPNEINSIAWSTGANSSTISVSTSGTYSVIVTNIYGCSDTSSINVSLHGIPYVELGSSLLLCSGDSTVLDAGTFQSYLWNDSTTNQALTVLDSGLYSVTVTDEFGCQGFDYISVNKSDIPVANFIANTSNGLYVTFADSSENAVSYSWDFNGDGVTDNTTAGDVSYFYSAQGQYNVILKVTNECGQSSYNHLIIVTNSAVQDIAFNNINIYPNPAGNSTTIEIQNGMKISNIELSNILGEKIICNQTKISENKILVDLTNIDTGYYIISVFDGDKTIKQTIVIEK